MLTIEILFPAGRYHATPWGRSVNEADIEWPPSPWRLLRTLLAIWHRKAPEIAASEVHSLVHRLSEQLPSYELPPAIHTHTRHYMPQKDSKTSLVYDAFLAIAPSTPLRIHWSELSLNQSEQETLSTLLGRMSYFGRAESWADAIITDELPHINCEPNGPSIDQETGEISGESVRILAPPTADDYGAWIDKNREQLLSSFKGEKRKKLAYIMPDTLGEALDRDTADWLAVDKSAPAFSRWINYTRPRMAIPVIRRATKTVEKPDIVRFALSGKPRLLLRNTLKQAEWFRCALIKHADKHPLLSGHNLPEHNQHLHAFILPEDLDKDGQLDHLILHVPGGIDAEGQAALHQIKRLWNYKGNTIDIALLDIGKAAEWAKFRATNNGLVGCSRLWQSATPWYCPWHIKKNRNMADEVQRYIARECATRQLPIPEVQLREHQQINEGEAPLPTSRFHYRRHQKPPPPSGNGLILELHFEEPLTGPLALGYGCHFGLGAFAPQ